MKAFAVILAILMLTAPVRAAQTFNVVATVDRANVVVGDMVAVALDVSTDGDGITAWLTIPPVIGLSPGDTDWSARGALADKPLVVLQHYTITCDIPPGDTTIPINVYSRELDMAVDVSVVVHNVAPAQTCHHTWIPIAATT